MTNHGTESIVHEATDRLRETVDEIKPKLRGWLHAVTVPLAFFAFIVMLVISDKLLVRVGVAVFMVSAMLLFGVSAVYHRGTWNEGLRGFWKRFDHANIFLLIAGSYTPFSLLLLTPSHAAIMLSAVWGGALLGVAFKIFWIGAPRWLYVPLYLLLGWAAVLYFPEFSENASTAVMVLLVAGGVLYTIGAVVYGFKWPNPSPTYFGFHEVFHAFTIAAFTVHYIGVSLLAYQQH
ncbi:MAG: hemolysin III family protein [Aeromicrobium sp.]